MYVGTILKKENSVEIKTIKIELIKKYFDEKLSSIKLKPEKNNCSCMFLIFLKNSSTRAGSFTILCS